MRQISRVIVSADNLFSYLVISGKAILVIMSSAFRAFLNFAVSLYLVVSVASVLASYWKYA